MYKKIYIEITNICNLNCSFCIKNKRPKKIMQLKEFAIILKKIKPHTNYLYFHVLGEPLMHPLINEFINLASQDFKINITTNGYLIDKIKNNKNIRQLNISLHSFQENNQISLEEYLNTIFLAVDRLKEKTYISYRLWTHTPYKNKILSILEDKYHQKIDKKMQLEENVFIDFEHSFIWPNLENEIIEEKGKCYALKDHIAILVDGTIIPCCLDSKGDINLGNIFTNSIDDIKSSSRYLKMLEGFRQNKKVEELCQRCNFLK